LTLDNAIPVEVAEEEDTLLNEAQRQKQIQIQLKKKKKQAHRNKCCLGVDVLTLTTVYFIATKGFTYVKDNIIGHPTKELLESEWERVNTVILVSV
jgi:hypothetical protein